MRKEGSLHACTWLSLSGCLEKKDGDVCENGKYSGEGTCAAGLRVWGQAQCITASDGHGKPAGLGSTIFSRRNMGSHMSLTEGVGDL